MSLIAMMGLYKLVSRGLTRMISSPKSVCKIAGFSDHYYDVIVIFFKLIRQNDVLIWSINQNDQDHFYKLVWLLLYQ